MFTAITHWFFGGEDETPKDLKSGEVVEEGWLLVSCQEAVNKVSSVEDQNAELANTAVHSCPSNPTVTEETDDNLETQRRVLESEPSVQTSTTTSRLLQSSVSQVGALAKVTQVGRVQKAQAWVDRHHLARSCIQRQNYVHQRTKCHSSHTHNTYLHQPGRRDFSH
ncbi:uncharacterized protein ACJ7VT_011136 [Polymixia lowei]